MGASQGAFVVLFSYETDRLCRRLMIRSSKSITAFTWPICPRVIKLSLPELAPRRTSGVLYRLSGCAPATRQAPTRLGASVWTNLLWGLEDEPEKIFNDSKRYDFGSDWQRIFTRVPQLLHPWGSRRNLQIYEEEKQEGLKESLEAERLAREDVEDADESWSEDGPYWPAPYSAYHAACQIGFIFIADEETLTAPHPKEATFLVVWYDPDGNVVRQYRLGAYDAQGLEALYCGSFPCEHTAWSLGVVGEQYDEDAPLGPPYELDEGDEADQHL